MKPRWTRRMMLPETRHPRFQSPRTTALRFDEAFPLRQPAGAVRPALSISVHARITPRHFIRCRVPAGETHGWHAWAATGNHPQIRGRKPGKHPGAPHSHFRGQSRVISRNSSIVSPWVAMERPEQTQAECLTGKTPVWETHESTTEALRTSEGTEIIRIFQWFQRFSAFQWFLGRHSSCSANQGPPSKNRGGHMPPCPMSCDNHRMPRVWKSGGSDSKFASNKEFKGRVSQLPIPRRTTSTQGLAARRSCR
jgi:hypothetical protein